MILIENIISKKWQRDIYDLVRLLPYTYNAGTAYHLESMNPIDLFAQGLEIGRDIVLDENTIETPQFVFVAQPSQPEYKEFIPFLYLIEDHTKKNIVEITRIKINCLIQNDNLVDGKHNIAHVDISSDDPNFLSAIYYVNDSDGDTFFFNEHFSDGEVVEKLTVKKRVTPKMGSMVIFPSDQYHASSNPVSNRSRFVINFLFRVSS